MSELPDSATNWTNANLRKHEIREEMRYLVGTVHEQVLIYARQPISFSTHQESRMVKGLRSIYDRHMTLAIFHGSRWPGQSWVRRVNVSGTFVLAAFKIHILSVLLGPAIWLSLFSQELVGQDSKPTSVIQNVRVVDVVHSVVSEPQAVVIVGDRIAAIGKSAADGLSANLKVVDAEGQYLIPGLFDAHTHLISDVDNYAPLLIAHGVTSVRDMGAPTEQILALKRGASDRSEPFPDITACGAIIDGKPPIWPFSEPCENADQARLAVRKLVAAGVDQLKVYSLLTPEAYQAAVDEATKLDRKVTGHVPYSVSMDEALTAGQDCIEHLEGFGPLFKAMVPDATRKEEGLTPTASAFLGWYSWDRVDRLALKEHLKRHAQANVVHCPTLVVWKSIGRISDEKDNPRLDPRMKYVSAAMLGFWDSGRYQNFSPRARQALPAMLELVREMNLAGIKIVVGTDLANPFVFAGSAVHDEMRLLASAGIPPAQVLRMATVNAAELCGVEADRGTIDVGKTASLVLLKSNPLESIEAIGEIEAVWLRGKHLRRGTLNRMLAKVQAGVSGTSNAAAIDLKPDLPGDIVLQGEYRMMFQQFAAGKEKFVLTREGDRWHLWSHSQPQGGGQQPALSRLTFEQGGRFVEGNWRQLAGETIEARYRIEGNQLITEATINGQAQPTSRIDLPEDFVFSSPSYAADFLNYGNLKLDVGQSKTAKSVGFGFPDWKPTIVDIAMERAADESIEVDGRSFDTRVFISTFRSELGEMKIQAWTDPDGHTLKTMMKFQFGSLSSTRHLQQ